MIESVALEEATEADRLELERFICGDGSFGHIDEIYGFVRHRALDYFLDAPDADADFRLLVLRGQPGGRLIGVAAHERNIRLVAGGDALPGTELSLIAIATAVQGESVAGTSLFRTFLGLVLDDIVARSRGSALLVAIHPENRKMLEICASTEGLREVSSLSDHRWFVARI